MVLQTISSHNSSLFIVAEVTQHCFTLVASPDNEPVRDVRLVVQDRCSETGFDVSPSDSSTRRIRTEHRPGNILKRCNIDELESQSELSRDFSRVLNVLWLQSLLFGHG